MKICCLILVHKNIDQVRLLCQRLNDSNIYVYIHLDKKMSVSEKEIENLKLVNKNLSVIPSRISCYLDDWSLVEATLSLIRYAFDKHNKEKCYYVLMSGQDYLIKKISELKSFLSRSYPMPFIDCTPYNVNNWVYPKFNHTKLMIWARKLRRRLNLKGVLWGTKIVERFLPQFMFVDYKIQQYNVPLYGGSAWWTLPGEMIKEMLDFLDSNKEFVGCYQLSSTPEETFFQTVAMQTSFASSIHLNHPSQISQKGITFSNFFSKTGEFIGHPHILVSEDLEWLMKEDKFIARKFDLVVDPNVFCKIDEYLNDEL